MKLIQWTLFIDMLVYGEINGMIESDKHADEFISFMSKNADIFDNKITMICVEGMRSSILKFMNITIFSTH
ncbi:hypothetical protein [Sphingobacterium endophyticum]|uniref:hypothetical protein n=1 Tax=Sphingobacterium endophyticum TaxID=2546448 RepID=UPI0012E29A60|nr:hypothetical protein [Sphingobacterium endophyticum]